MAHKEGESTDMDKKKSGKVEEWDSLYDDSGECVKILENVCIILFLNI